MLLADDGMQQVRCWWPQDTCIVTGVMQGKGLMTTYFLVEG
jgi:hypothetical protein